MIGTMQREAWVAAVVFLAGCVAPAPPPPVFAPAAPPPASPPAAAEPAPAAPAAPTALYPIEDAIADVLSGPLEYVGAGGGQGVLECVYRNARVLVMDAYCTARAGKAFGVDVLSPTRGRVHIYAEAKQPIRGLAPSAYTSFYVESQLPATGVAPALSLSLASYDDVAAAFRAHVKQFPPSCVVGTEVKWKQACAKTLDALAPAFFERTVAFVRTPPEAWTKLVNAITDERAKGRIRVTPSNRRALAEKFARTEETSLYSYHLDRIGNTEGFAAPIIATADGGTLLVGTRRGARPVAVRFDERMKVRWEVNLRRKGYDDFEAASAVTVPGGYVVFVPSHVSANRSAVSRLVKLDDNGRPVWEWLGRGTGGVGTPFIDRLQAKPDGTLLLTGHVLVEKGTIYHAWSAEVDPAGKLVHERTGDVLPPAAPR